MSNLDTLGTLYRNAEGNEVWRVRDTSGASGAIVAEDVASDFDVAWIADQQVEA